MSWVGTLNTRSSWQGGVFRYEGLLTYPGGSALNDPPLEPIRELYSRTRGFGCCDLFRSHGIPYANFLFVICTIPGISNELSFSAHHFAKRVGKKARMRKPLLGIKTTGRCWTFCDTYVLNGVFLNKVSLSFQTELPKGGFSSKFGFSPLT